MILNYRPPYLCGANIHVDATVVVLHVRVGGNISTVFSPNGEERVVVCSQGDPRVLGVAAGQDVAPRCGDDPIHGDGQIDVRSKLFQAACDTSEHLGVLAAGKELAVASDKRISSESGANGR